MNCRPIGLQHSSDCDGPDGDVAEWDRLCDECQMQASHEWDLNEKEDET